MDCIDMERLAAGEPADPITLPKVDRYAHPTTDPRCRGQGFRFDPNLSVADKLKIIFPG
jgi:hypothetical protein